LVHLYLEQIKFIVRGANHPLFITAPAPEESQAEATKPNVKLSSNAKVTKKPAKKRAEARLETAAPALATLAEAQTTQQSPEQPLSSNGDYDLDMYHSVNHVENTYSFAYAESGCKPTQPMTSQTQSYFKNYQMRIMVDSGEMHSIRITSPQLLYQTAIGGEDNAGNAAAIRNIPKKRKPVASSTPLARNPKDEVAEERDDNDLEVATM